jgi:type IV pilus assembly protein PilQ
MLGLSACASKNQIKFEGDELIDTSTTFDREKFIEQSRQRSLNESKFGPDVEAGRPITEADRYRKLVNKEETFDYVDMAGLEKSNFKVSVNVENMSIRDFADMLSTITGVNILVSDEVNGVISAKLNDVYWTSMLDSILNTKRLAKHIDTKSNIIRIHDQTTAVQLEDFEEKRKENVQKSLMLKKASQPLLTEIFKLFYTKPEQIKIQIDSILSNKGAGTETVRNINPEVTVDTRKNLLVVKARKEDMEIISKLITELDTRTQQIYIEAFIVEVDDGFEQAFGTRFGANFQKPGNDITQAGGVAGTVGTMTLGNNSNTISNLPVNNAFGGIGVIGGIGNSTTLKLELSAMETQGLSKVISNPKIFTLDNQEAIIFQGDEIPYSTVSQQGTEIQFKEAGLKLAVTPQIIGDGNLQLSIQVNKDTADVTVSNPPITKSEIKTNLVTKDGDVVVMGGIYTENKSKTHDKVPGLADIPVLGNLFKRKSNQNDRKELIIFISPKIL